MQTAYNTIKYEVKIVGRLIKILALEENIVCIFYTNSKRGIQEDRASADPM